MQCDLPMSAFIPGLWGKGKSGEPCGLPEQGHPQTTEQAGQQEAYQPGAREKLHRRPRTGWWQQAAGLQSPEPYLGLFK
jgi:hypothetical protein